MKWVCQVCGYVHEGDAAPDVCPICGVGPDQFDKVDNASNRRESEREEQA